MEHTSVSCPWRSGNPATEGGTSRLDDVLSTVHKPGKSQRISMASDVDTPAGWECSRSRMLHHRGRAKPRGEAVAPPSNRCHDFYQYPLRFRQRDADNQSLEDGCAMPLRDILRDAVDNMLVTVFT